MPSDVSAAAWATHQDLSPVAERFLRHALAHSQALRYRDYRRLLTGYAQRFEYELQPWPTFVDARKMQQMKRAILDVSHLVKSIPERIFGGDAGRMCEFYGLRDEGLLELLLSPPQDIDTAFVRGDFVDDGTDFKCLELNISATIGGWQLRFFEQACRLQPFVAEFLAREGARPYYRDPLRMAMEMLVRSGCRQRHDVAGRFNVAILIEPEHLDLDVKAVMNELLGEALRQDGGHCQGEIIVCSLPHELVARGTSLTCRGVPVSAVIDSIADETPRDAYRCFKARRLGLFNGPLGGLLGDKRNLALLSRHEESDLLTAEERAIILRTIPWSREVITGRTTWHGESVDLIEFACARRESLVLKPLSGEQGIGVVLGSRTPPAEWRRRLDDAAGTMLLQEYVASRPYLYQHGPEGWAPHQVIWGIYDFGGTYGGAFLRLLPFRRGPSVINAARGATEGLVFEV